MKNIFNSLLLLLLSGILTDSLSIPTDAHDISRRESEAGGLGQSLEASNEQIYTYLEKRRGGGGKGGGSSSGGSSSGGSSSGGKTGSSGSSGSSGTKGGSTSSTSSSSPSYGGGRYYSGGATRSYSSGQRSPLGVAPFFLGGAALGFFPGVWLYGAYAYPYTHNYSYRNNSSPNARNESLPIVCLCDQYSACGCDDNANLTYIDTLLKNNTLARIENVNGTEKVVLNGTLPNGTDTTSGAAGGMRHTLAESSGFWIVGAIVGMIVWGL
ncbi:hypothetical protein MMC14_002927 [Varicellaria rhodocarpa]|nr:hypothetical protein [Varicellaria rhodocarpa]